ncbi:MAG: orotidine-5'-phosphate decarboxylase [Candidatus Marsarchaeota archaeon]|jgi:orotidine-5'-phosphate decarboxylase|nr:orotidine-5'-phosphate decarboxylase [Candidatus Marsarchaeota archaeon]
MDNYADKLLNAVKRKGNPCIVGLDPRLDQMPDFVKATPRDNLDRAVRRSIIAYHKCIIRAVAGLVPGVKLQSAFYEQYGIGGMQAFMDTVRYARERGLVVIIDAKRNDISSTAEAYANAFLGRTQIFGNSTKVIDADCITVSPYLGKDSLDPFVEACKAYGKGIFILVKTSNPGSSDLQDRKLSDGSELYIRVAELVNRYSEGLTGELGYSPIGAVVGATFPEEAMRLRKLMPRSIFLVPGYGAQGGTAAMAAECFNDDGYGAVVNASRSLTYGLGSPGISRSEAVKEIKNRTKEMIERVNEAIRTKTEKRSA